MRTRMMAAVFAALLSVFALSGLAFAADGLAAQMNKFEETPATLSGHGTGVFLGLITSDQNLIPYQIFYTDLTGPAVVAHIHFGKPGETGGIAAFLCGGGNKPSCPDSGVLLQGVVTAADVQALPAQSLAAGDLAALIQAIKAGFAYVNVHTGAHPGGEIRGQLQGGSR